MELTIQFDAASQAKLARFSSFDLIHSEELRGAASQALDMLQYEAVNFMYSHFQDPQGELEESFYQVIDYPNNHTVQGTLANPSAHAWRRHEGFSGMTDSAGRFFAHDPGIFYLSEPLAQHKDEVLALYKQAVEQYLSGV